MAKTAAQKGSPTGSPDADALTGLPSYEVFVNSWESGVAAAEQTGGVVSVGLVDIDFFGAVNNTHGNDAGDGVLTLMAASLSGAIEGHGRVFRYGGDAFSVLLAGVEKEQAFLILEAARKKLDQKYVVEAGGKKVELALTVSIGIATFPDDGDVQDVVRKANEALYRAKDSGRNKVCLAREEKMVTKTSHYTQGQLQGLSRLARRMGIGEAVLLREALDGLLRKYNA